MTSRPLALCALALSVAACDDGATVLPPETAAPPVAAQGTTPPATTPATKPDSAARPDTANATVAGIRVSPRTFTLVPGRTVRVDVQAVNAQGLPVRVLLAGPPTLRTGDAGVATVGENQTLVGVAVGTTRLYATSGQWSDSVAVTVVAAPPPLPAATRIDLPDRVLPAALGRPVWIGARFLDADGRPARGPGGRAQWRSSNAAVATVVDTLTADSIAVAVLTGVSAGTATVHVTVGALTDSMRVEVTPTLPAATPSDTAVRPPAPPAAAPVARFTLTALVTMPGAGSAGDSARSAPAVGARVSVYRVTRDSSAARTDTLGTQTLAGSGVADAQGRVVVPDLPSSLYRVVAEPPAGDAVLQRVERFLAPPTAADVRLPLHLDRKR